MTDLAATALRQADRAYGSMKAIHDDIKDGEFDGARSHIEILKRQLTDLSEKLYEAATGYVHKVGPGGSIECPHCKWGFAPSVINQHIREKH